jgi:N-acyl homoserine lactone hydrolase
MPGCTIYPIPIFSRENDMSSQLYRLEHGRKTTVAGMAWYIEGAGPKILVDTGAGIDYLRASKGYPCTELQTLEQGLGKLGLKCADIDIVLFTHLHHDHTAKARLFPRARLIAQKDEVEFAHHPHPFFASAFPPEFLDGVQFDTVEGDYQVTECVSLLRTPGHSVGGQSVAVQTARGLAIISGMCCRSENFYPSGVGSKLEVIPPTPHLNVIDVYESMVKIKKLADILIPNHDPGYLTVAKIPA